MEPDDRRATPDPDAETGGTLDLRAESLQVRLEEHPYQRVRVYRDVVTEEVTRTFTVRREVLRVEHEDITVGDTASARAPLGQTSAAPTGDRSIEVILHEERPVVSLEVVPVERVTVGVQRRTEQVEVHDTVRREEADLVVTPTRYDDV